MYFHNGEGGPFFPVHHKPLSLTFAYSFQALKMLHLSLIKKWLPTLLLGLTLLAPGIKAQDVINPSRLVIHTDGARITQKGILRFKEKKARFNPMVMPLPGSVEVARSQEYQLQYLKFVEVLDTQLTPVTGWVDILEANEGKSASITYQIGAEFDELTGVILAVDRASSLVLLRKSEQDIYIPFDQVRQVSVPAPNGSFLLPRVRPHTMIEIGIDKELPFAPVEFTGTLNGISWVPSCKIRLIDGKTARFQMSAVLSNSSGVSVDGIETELAAGSLLGTGADPKAASWRHKAGKLTLKKGETLFLNFPETAHEYETQFTCTIPWKGPGPETRSEPLPVVHSLRFTTPVSTAIACETVTVLDPEGKFLADTRPSGGEITQLVLGGEAAIKVTVMENGEYDEAKTVKVDDKSYRKVRFTGKIVISNLKSDAVNLKVSREINGEVIDVGNAVTEATDKPNQKNLTWTRSIRTGSSETITYSYFTLLPLQ